MKYTRGNIIKIKGLDYIIKCIEFDYDICQYRFKIIDVRDKKVYFAVESQIDGYKRG